MIKDNLTVANSSCLTTYSGKVNLDDIQRYVLVAANLVIMLINLFVNVFVVAVMAKTKQLNNTSLHLICFLSLSDICLAVVTQPLFTLMLVDFAGHTYCDYETINQFFAKFLTHTSAYTIACIGYDRYMRMRYLSRYTTMMKPITTRMIFLMIVVLALCEATLYVVGTQQNFFKKAKIVAVVIDFCVGILVIVAYLMTVKVVRDRRINSTLRDVMNQADRTITNVAARILLSLIVFYLPYMAISILYSEMYNKIVFGKKWLSFALFLGFLLTYCNSIANAVIFLSSNTKIRSMLKRRSQTDSRTYVETTRNS